MPISRDHGNAYSFIIFTSRPVRLSLNSLWYRGVFLFLELAPPTCADHILYLWDCSWDGRFGSMFRASCCFQSIKFQQLVSLDQHWTIPCKDNDQCEVWVLLCHVIWCFLPSHSFHLIDIPPLFHLTETSVLKRVFCVKSAAVQILHLLSSLSSWWPGADLIASGRPFSGLMWQIFEPQLVLFKENC